MRGEVEERSQAPLTAEHLARLGRLVSNAHEQLKARRPDLAGTLVAGVLAQGAAAHYLHPDAGVGVKDLDLWLFYAQRDGVRKVQERGRALVLDFGRQRWVGTRRTRRSTGAGASTFSPARSPPRRGPTRPTRSAPG